jgi:2-desacetyl-2-hydroxyethyl bacteriochlorophyllide A dehydrogenase
MKAVQIYGPNDARLVDVPTPKPGPGEALCKVVRSGICGTDYSIYTGDFSFVKSGAIKFPMTPGHEWSGVVEEVGSGVENFKPGDRVVGDTAVSCGTCYDCLMGQYGHCRQLRCVGTINTWDGAYAEYILMPVRHLFHLPDNVNFDQGAMVEPAATALYSVTLAGVKAGDTVLVQGSGPIGIIAAKLAKLSGAAKVIITGRKDFKLQTALSLGVDVAINVKKVLLSEGIKAQVDVWGVDRIIEASGSIELFQESLKLIRPGGTIAVVAFYEKMVNNFDIDRFVFGDVTIRAVAGSLGMYLPILRLMSSGMLNLSSLITDRYQLKEVPQAMQDVKGKSATRIKMMIDVADVVD